MSMTIYVKTLHGDTITLKDVMPLCDIDDIKIIINKQDPRFKQTKYNLSFGGKILQGMYFLSDCQIVNNCTLTMHADELKGGSTATAWWEAMCCCCCDCNRRLIGKDL